MTELHEAQVPDTRDLYVLSEWAYDVMAAAGYDVVVATVHGSYLYGTNHASSDLDFYVVVAEFNDTTPEKKNHSAKIGDLDVHVVDLDTWLNNASVGSHQAIEVLFSPYAKLSVKWGPLVRALRPSRYRFLAKSRSASQHLIDRDDPKKHRRTWTFLRHAYAYFNHGDPFYRQYHPLTELTSGDE